MNKRFNLFLMFFPFFLFSCSQEKENKVCLAYESQEEEFAEVQTVGEKNLELDFIEGRVNYLRKYNHKFYKDSKKQYVYSIILFTLFVENVSLFSQFYIINWFTPI